jgi:hypothetical protein
MSLQECGGKDWGMTEGGGQGVLGGAFHVDRLENGDLETVVTGRNILGNPVAGLVLAMGRFSFVFDAGGNLIQPLQGTGRLLDICELLT